MNKINLSFSRICCKDTPKSKINTSQISKDIAKHPQCLTISEIAGRIEAGYSFCPAVFSQPERKIEFVSECQLFALDFDEVENGSAVLPYQEAVARAEKYKLPVVISYQTKSSVNFSKFRLLFLCREPITDKRLMKLIIMLLLNVFPEADRACSDISRMFYPGKDVKVLSEEGFYFDHLLIAAEHKARERKNQWTNQLKSMQRKTNVYTIGSTIKIDYPENCPENALYISVQVETLPPRKANQNSLDFDTKSLILYRENVLNSKEKVCIFFNNDIGTLPINRTPKPRDQFRSRHIVSIDDCEKCPILSDFCNGERRLPHEEWWNTMLNLIHLSNGQMMFINTLKTFQDDYGDIDLKIQQMKYAVQQEYSPALCDNYCPYADTCNHKSTMVSTIESAARMMIKLDQPVNYSTTEEIYSEIQQFIAKAADSPNTFTVIKTQTGTGKTTAALEFMSTSQKRVVMAFPNRDLMLEMYRKAVSMGIEADYTPSVNDIYSELTDEEYETVQRYYSNGSLEMPIKYIRSIAEGRIPIEQFLEKYDSVRSYSGHLFTTHSRLIAMSSSLGSNDVVIIDEDIIPMIMPVKQIQLEELQMLAEDMYSLGQLSICAKLNSIIAAVKEKTRYIHTCTFGITDAEQSEIIEALEAKHKKYTSCILGAICESFFYYDRYSNGIYFTRMGTLSNLPAYIMMSATADSFVCKKLFYKPCKFNFYECKKARYKGTVRLISDRTYSRSCFATEPALIGRIVSKHPDDCYITFKNHISDIHAEESHKLYYGKAVGTNSFTGRNITIIGTPHKPAYAYILFAEKLGIRHKDSLSMRRIQANGFEFGIMTFKYKSLQNIQKYMLNTELEQAVGRARLVHNDCTVTVYSAFPVEQADI